MMLNSDKFMKTFTSNFKNASTVANTFNGFKTTFNFTLNLIFILKIDLSMQFDKDCYHSAAMFSFL